MIETIALIVSVSTGVLSSIVALRGLQHERKQRIEDFFNLMADTIDSAVVKFKANEIPHGACDAMRNYALQLPSVLEGAISDEKLQMYSEQLYRAHEIEQLNIAVQENPDGLVELEKAASGFRVAANLIKLSK